jgi:heme exporter protein A
MLAGRILAERVLELRRVSKYFGDSAALRNVSLRFSSGECVLIYGPNGAGKTTLLRMLASLSQPTEGEIWLDGDRVPRQSAEYKRRIGFVSHATLLYDDLTVQENLRLAGKLFGLTGLDARIDFLLDLFAVQERRTELVRTLSRGLQQRVTLVRALLHEPDFVLLDEPFTGLDAASSSSLENVLRRLAEQGHAVIFSTHDFAQGASIAGRLVALEKGRLHYDGPVSEAACTLLRIRREENNPQITQMIGS